MILLRLFAIVALMSVNQSFGAPHALTTQALALAESTTDSVLQQELLSDVAMALARAGERPTALALAQKLPLGQRGLVLLEVAAHLPAQLTKEAEQLVLDAQTDKALTTDWRKARLARLLAVAYARLGKFEAAEALAHTVPDTEEKAFALQHMVLELNRRGQAAKARELAGTIEENRRYGTYRQKAAALADCARSVHARGNPDEASTLLSQAELLLPKKPGWSDGGAYRDVAVAAYACEQHEKAAELLTRAEALAQQIAGPWQVSELTQVAAAWRACGDAARADLRLADAAAFLDTLTPLDRAEQAPTLARAWAASGAPQKAHAVLAAVRAEAERAGNTEVWRKPRVRALLAEAELSRP